MRVEYGSAEKDGSADLDPAWLGADPASGWVSLLESWLAEAHQAGVAEPNAMVVGTVDAEGRPVTRTVLCKSVSETGISFYTNYESDKGRQLAANPYASATFPWYQLGRQVHVRGPVLKVSAQETADYWSTRPVAHSSVRGRRRRAARSRRGRTCCANSPRSPNGSPALRTCPYRRTGVAT